MPFHHKRGLVALLCLAGAAAIAATGIAARIHRQGAAEPTPLPTGKLITPIGEQTEVGSFPVNLAVSPDGKYVVVTNSGFRQYLTVLRMEDGKVVSQLPFNAPRKDKPDDKAALYVGLAFAPASAPPFTLYASRGPEDKVSLHRLDADGNLSEAGRSLENPSSLPKEAGNAQPNFLAGIALSADGSRLYVANNMTSAYTDQKGSVSILDTRQNRVIGKVVTPGFPYAVAALTRGENADKKIYVTSERDSVVSVLDVSDPAAPKLRRNVATGAQPIALAFDREQKRLYVANSGSDTISVLDTASDKVVGTVLLRPEEARGLPGATPTGLALSPDESRLYVTLADMNAVAVVSLKGNTGTLAGYIPAGWYPTSVAVSLDGESLFVANAKGIRPRNPNKEKSGPNGEWGDYILNIMEGTVSRLPAPPEALLKRLTTQVLANNFITPDLANANKNLGLPPGIKHVLYIIKENRTYDQVLGDMPQGNGDPSLVLFGREVTPNQHALAERFVLLDNFYVCAECSADGWSWSVSGMLSAYNARNTPFNYSGRGRNYDFEGATNNVPVDRLGLPDVARAPSGYIWDNALKHGVSVRNYGFYATFGADKRPDLSPLSSDNIPTKKALVNRTDPDFPRYDMAFADSDAWVTYNCASPNQKKSFGRFNAPSRVAEWKREFDQYLQKGNLPRFMMVRLPRDHTSGTRPDEPTPRAMVADNDYALGQLVEAVSKSRVWKETAIFVLEDDAQDGPDHVDPHRSIAFVISPYVRRNLVDHRFYNTDSMLRTMQALLGLPPMSQYDAVAPVMRVFSAAPDNAEPYTAVLPSREIVSALNKRTAYRANDSLKLDFVHADRVPDAVLNDILWHDIKGANAPEPPVRRALRLSPARPHRDDDD